MGFRYHSKCCSHGSRQVCSPYLQLISLYEVAVFPTALIENSLTEILSELENFQDLVIREKPTESKYIEINGWTQFDPERSRTL